MKSELKISLAATIAAIGLTSSMNAFAMQALSVKAALSDLHQMTVVDGMSHYQEVMSNFDQGTVPSTEEMQGWWSGRCFSKDEQNSAGGMLLVAQTVVIPPAPGTDNGPMFPAPQAMTTFNYAPVTWNGVIQPANRFDNLSDSDVAMVQDYLRYPEWQTIVSSVSNGSLLSTNDPGNLKFLTRKSGEYFITEAIILRDQENYKAGDVFEACYFFKKVHE